MACNLTTALLISRALLFLSRTSRAPAPRGGIELVQLQPFPLASAAEADLA
eukprot:CAMPEP_0203933412 /NCGR_PEP_ID=MMETSP0359-20131031/71602_1 /ASSEMBLY_ACC=CAM_ASM_000338 /TAXON_ID=268821 /ORGANISM="Scrippsiella Hangoei, Strain SHTV-5" /LENGTH=50 /DNA_ID=CAMNT_0050862989 /DNA_START=51 /DNA_END=201 /DNA_ORIENTATION=-